MNEELEKRMTRLKREMRELRERLEDKVAEERGSGSSLNIDLGWISIQWMSS